jgi:hypothetical protein
MKRIQILDKGLAFLVVLVALGLTSCTSLSQNTQTPTVSATWTQEELNQAKRLRNDPRLYGIKFTPEQYASYLAITGQTAAPGK